MLNLEMSCAHGCAVVSASGALMTIDDADTIAAALNFVPADDHLIIDLRGIDHLTTHCARTLTTALAHRVASAAEVVVVIDRPEVAMPLIVSNADRIAPLMTSMHQALQVIRVRSGHDAMEVA